MFAVRQVIRPDARSDDRANPLSSAKALPQKGALIVLAGIGYNMNNARVASSYAPSFAEAMEDKKASEDKRFLEEFLN